MSNNFNIINTNQIEIIHNILKLITYIGKYLDVKIFYKLCINISNLRKYTHLFITCSL